MFNHLRHAISDRLGHGGEGLSHSREGLGRGGEGLDHGPQRVMEATAVGSCLSVHITRMIADNAQGGGQVAEDGQR